MIKELAAPVAVSQSDATNTAAAAVYTSRDRGECQ